MRLLILIITALFYLPSWAANDPCASVKNSNIGQDTTIFVYEKIKNNKVFYIPIMVMKDDQFSRIGKLIMPKEMTLFNLHTGKSINVRFKNSFNSLENSCQSIGYTKTATGINASEQLYATKVIKNSFNFSPRKDDIKLFQANISNPCAANKPKYDKDGVMLCDADKLVAVSNLNNQKQFWHTKQYRYDLGFGVDFWDPKTQKFNQIVEDCSVCSD